MSEPHYFVKQIIDKMTEVEMSRSSLAEDIDETPQAINNWLSGRHEPPLDTLARMAWSVGLDVLIVPEP